jgi:hypothetical protein
MQAVSLYLAHSVLFDIMPKLVDHKEMSSLYFGINKIYDKAGNRIIH